MVGISDKTRSIGEGNGKPLQYSCLENPMKTMKRQKERTLKEELPRSVGAQYATGDQWRNNSTKTEEMEPKQKQHPVVDVTGDRSKVRLYAGQEATVRTGHGTTDWFQIGKGGCQGCILSPCLFNLYAEYIMRNAGLEEAQAGIKIAGRNINNLRYVDDTTLMAESEEELKSPLMKVKEESEKVRLKFNIQKTKIMASGPITSWEIDGEAVETVTDFILGGLQNHCRW